MDVSQPRARRRGFFLHSDTDEPDTGEHETPEGLALRVRTSRGSDSRQIAGMATSRGRSRTARRAEDVRPQIRSGSVTGSRQRSNLPR